MWRGIRKIISSWRIAREQVASIHQIAAKRSSRKLSTAAIIDATVNITKSASCPSIFATLPDK
jgi:hypothetical protein